MLYNVIEPKVNPQKRTRGKKIVELYLLLQLDVGKKIEIQVLLSTTSLRIYNTSHFVCTKEQKGMFLMSKLLGYIALLKSV